MRSGGFSPWTNQVSSKLNCSCGSDLMPEKNCTVQSLYNASFGVHKNLGAIACNERLSKSRVAMVRGKVGEFHFQSGKFRKSEKVMGKSGNLKKIQKVSSYQASGNFIFHELKTELAKIIFLNINCKQYLQPRN